MAGDAETGVAVMKMEEGLDTGPVAMAERVSIDPDMTAGELHDRLAPLGADLMVRALAALSRGALSFTPQSADGVTYAHKIANAEARIDWDKPAGAVHNHVRGLSPFPGAFFTADLGKGRGAGQGAPHATGGRRWAARRAPRPARHRRLRRGRGPACPGATGRPAAGRGGRLLARSAPAGRSLADRRRRAMIRLETTSDRDAVRAVLASAFPSAAEADLVDALRAAGDLVLALVAEEEDVVGFIRLLAARARASGASRRGARADRRRARASADGHRIGARPRRAFAPGRGRRGSRPGPRRDAVLRALRLHAAMRPRGFAPLTTARISSPRR